MGSKERALFLFDGPNFYKNLMSSALKKGHLDFFRLSSNLAMDREVVAVKFFTSPVDQNTDADNYKKQQIFFVYLTSSGVDLCSGHLVKRNIKCNKCKASPVVCKDCGEQLVIKTEKSLDVQIAMASVLGAVQDEYDCLYLASCDSDLVPAVKFVREQGKKVFLLLPDGAKGYAVGEVCSGTIPITQEKINAAQVIFLT